MHGPLELPFACYVSAQQHTLGIVARPQHVPGTLDMDRLLTHASRRTCRRRLPPVHIDDAGVRPRSEHVRGAGQ
jgi:hypothetical protein